MLDQKTHRNYMYQILIDIFNSPLKNYLAFKWWTLCYFIYGLGRFSTDLDFDILKNNKDIIPLLEKILQKHGAIKDKHDKKNTIFFLFDYWQYSHKIKLELSKNKQPQDKYEIINFFWAPISAMTKDCIFSNKLVATSERYTNRDLFDIHFFFKNLFPINEELIVQRTWWSYKKLCKTLIQEIPKHYKPNTLLAEMWELITEKQKFFIKNKLIEETLGYLNFELSK